MRATGPILLLLLTGCGREDAVRAHLEDNDDLRDIELRHTGEGRYIYTATRGDGAACQGDAQADGLYLGCAQRAEISSTTHCTRVSGTPTGAPIPTGS